MSDSAKRAWRNVGIFVVVTVALGYFYAWVAPHAFPGFVAPGFFRGMLHGAMMPMALPSLVLGQNVPIYSVINAGIHYKIGYIVGINLCGLVFFGSLFGCLARRRAPVTTASPQKSE